MLPHLFFLVGYSAIVWYLAPPDDIRVAWLGTFIVLAGVGFRLRAWLLQRRLLALFETPPQECPSCGQPRLLPIQHTLVQKVVLSTERGFIRFVRTITALLTAADAPTRGSTILLAPRRKTTVMGELGYDDLRCAACKAQVFGPLTRRLIWSSLAATVLVLLAVVLSAIQSYAPQTMSGLLSWLPPAELWWRPDWATP